MKKYLLSAMFCLASIFAMGQTGWFDNYTESVNTSYYSYSLYNNTLFPDSTVKALYGNGSGGTSLYYVSSHDVGEVFDPKSFMYNNPITKKDPYTIDSVGLRYEYHYVYEPGAAPDTLIFQFYTGAGAGTSSSAAIDTGYFAAQPANGFPQEPYAIVKYDYKKDLGTGAAAQYKYVLSASDTASSLIIVPTNGANGIAVKANDLFAFTLSYRPGFKYKTGDTIDELMSPKPTHLHSHFKFLIGNSIYKDATTDFEQSLTIPTATRYNFDPNWDGLYIPGTAWFAYNQILWANFHIRAKNVTALAASNDAGITSIANPSGNICAGYQTVKVSLENFGRKTLTSAKINWSVNGTVQTPYVWTGSLDSGYKATVAISAGYSFSAGSVNITAFTTSPNGVKDSVPKNDTAHINFTVSQAPVVQAGSSSSICGSKSVTIGAAAISGYSYSWTSNPSGFTSTSANPTVSPGTNTIYVLTETISATGCSNKDSVAITVNPLPSAGFSVKNVGKYYDFNVKDSSLSASSYQWDFGDGSSTTGYSETHVFPKNTAYLVKLKVTNSAGCSAEFDSAIQVTASGISNDAGIDLISSPSGNMCPGTKAVKVIIESFGRKTLASAKINWTVNGAAQTPYLWTGSLDSGFKDTVTISGGYNFSAGIVNIKVFTTLPNGVKDSVPANDTVHISFTVNPRPVVKPGSSSSICSGNSVTIGSTAISGYSYSWTSNPSGFTSTVANPAVSPGATITYTLTETINATGCSNKDSVMIMVNPLPNAGWTVTSAGKYFTFKVKDSLSTSSFQWDFGDGSLAATGYHEIHVFPANADYKVKLRVTSGAGCTNEMDSSITVSVLDIAEAQTRNFNLNIYPNPATNLLNLVFTNPLNNPATITIADQLGQVLSSRQIDGKSSVYEQDISGLAKGIYILNVQTQEMREEKYMFMKE